jgi:hypothetical protein
MSVEWNKNEMGGTCGTYWEEKIYTGCSYLLGKPEGKPPLDRPVLRWEGNIKIDLKKPVCGR